MAVTYAGVVISCSASSHLTSTQGQEMKPVRGFPSWMCSYIIFPNALEASKGLMYINRHLSREKLLCQDCLRGRTEQVRQELR